ncbi:MAG: hypothetical protein HQ594_07655 [Candidatus Omnitrophica bacterium]|nr:hypothetical protein [Candidatus Omnitrophota bacterium]
MKVLGVKFINDRYSPEEAKDRNLFIGNARIVYEDQG